MIRRIVSLLAVALLAVAGFASPAQASVTTIYGCEGGSTGSPVRSVDSICMYNWINFNQYGGYHTWTMQSANSAGCTNLMDEYEFWPAPGVTKYHTVSSLGINTGPFLNGFTHGRFTIYAWQGCNAGGGSSGFEVIPNHWHTISNMANVNLNDKTASFRFYYY